MNFSNPQVIWGALIVIAALAVIGLMAFGWRRSRTAQLREHFGNEYDRTVDAAGSRSRAEDALVARAEEVRQFDIRPLTAAERQRFTSDWRSIEARFVDRPATSVVEADELITEIMRTRGYPMADFNKYSDYLSVKHPRVIEHYRAGHDIIERHGGKSAASTEELRQAVLHYRALFEELVNDGDVVRDVRPAREVVEGERPRA